MYEPSDQEIRQFSLELAIKVAAMHGLMPNMSGSIVQSASQFENYIKNGLSSAKEEERNA